MSEITKEQVKKEQISETLIHEAINSDSSNKTYIQLMQSAHEEPTSKKEQTEEQPLNDLQKQTESTSMVQKSNNEMDKPTDANDGNSGQETLTYQTLERRIGYDFQEGNPNEPYLPLEAIAEKAGMELSYAYDLLQHHEHRDCDGNWSGPMVDNGYIVLSSYIVTNPYSQIETRIKKELLSPNAQELFLALFTENYW